MLCWEFWFPSLLTWGTDLLWMGWFPYLCGCPCLLVLVCSIKPSLAAYHPYHCLRCCLRLDSSTSRPETKIWVQEFGRGSQEARAWEMRAKRGREPRQCWLMRLLLWATGVQSQQGPLRDYAEYARVVLPQQWGAKIFTTQLLPATVWGSSARTVNFPTCLARTSHGPAARDPPPVD